MNEGLKPAAPASRPVSDQGRDDTVVPFSVEQLDIRGRVVRLGASVDHILGQHGYPAPVAGVARAATASSRSAS